MQFHAFTGVKERSFAGSFGAPTGLERGEAIGHGVKNQKLPKRIVGPW